MTSDIMEYGQLYVRQKQGHEAPGHLICTQSVNMCISDDWMHCALSFLFDRFILKCFVCLSAKQRAIFKMQFSIFQFCKVVQKH